MAIKKRSGEFKLHLQDVFDRASDKEGNFTAIFAELDEADPVLTFKRMSGRDFDKISTQMVKANVEIQKRNLTFQETYEITDIKEDPESLQVLAEVFEQVFIKSFISLTGFEDEEGNPYTDAKEAFEAVFDFFPIMVLYVGKYILEKQVPSAPES